MRDTEGVSLEIADGGGAIGIFLVEIFGDQPAIEHPKIAMPKPAMSSAGTLIELLFV